MAHTISYPLIIILIPAPLYENDYFGNPTNILNQAYVQLIQRHDTLFFAWRSSVNNAWLKLNGV